MSFQTEKAGKNRIVGILTCFLICDIDRLFKRNQTSNEGLFFSLICLCAFQKTR